MNNISLSKEWSDTDGTDTEALSIDTDELYTVSEFITLLEEAKRRWGNKKIVFHDMNTNSISGFSTVYLHHRFDIGKEYGEDYDDQICIFG